MESIEFYKYQGTGNDFVMIDNRGGQFPVEDLSLVRQLCRRKFGIGADGLILLQNHATCDFEMIYFNADGTQSLCGNGSRCAVHFANLLGMIGHSALFHAIDGEHHAKIEDGLVHFKMHNVDQAQMMGEDYFIDTGSPHYIKFVEDVEPIDVYEEGRKIRYSEKYRKEGTNVNFAAMGKDNDVSVRTYERGVEDETLSCGTGVTAVALAAVQRGMKPPVKIHARGGELQVDLKKNGSTGFKDIYLIGPAEMVFKGNKTIIK